MHNWASTALIGSTGRGEKARQFKVSVLILRKPKQSVLLSGVSTAYYGRRSPIILNFLEGSKMIMQKLIVQAS